MCNLYRMRSSVAEVARIFGVVAGPAPNFADEVYPGYPGLVVAGDTLRTMSWGFPLALRSRRTGRPLKPKPVNNAREDKLATPFWRDSFKSRRCLIPVTAWAEAEGDAGRMTRSWHAVPDKEPFAVAGIWRPTAEWGDAYAMVMVDGCPQMSECHDRMPTILHQDDWNTWTRGTPEEAFALCRVWVGPLLVDRTDQPWAKVRQPGSLLL